MLISQTYLISKMTVLNVFIPANPDDATDEVVKRILCICGRHERVLGLPWCSKITNEILPDIKKCAALQHLDISFTNITQLTPIINCRVLRTLSIAGLKCDNYECLAQMDTLEILNLHNSTISNSNCLLYLSRLRSLDIGNTLISSKTTLCSLTRLEELYMDSTPTESDPIISNFSKLCSLKLLNIGDSDMAVYKQELSAVLPSFTVVQYSARRVYFIEALIKNDIQAVKEYINTGIDVNMRVGEWGSELLASTWKNRCQASTIFFDCNHPDESLRPNAVHVAVYFNSQESLQVLIKAQVFG